MSRKYFASAASGFSFPGPQHLCMHIMGDWNRNAFICNKDVIELYKSARFCCGHLTGCACLRWREKVKGNSNASIRIKNSYFLSQAAVWHPLIHKQSHQRCISFVLGGVLLGDGQTWYYMLELFSVEVSGNYFGLAVSLVLHGFSMVWDWPISLIGR